jgi:hypothetical protein
VQCLHRWQKVLRPGLVKGPWTPEEDATILNCLQQGINKWSEIADCIPGRIGKQCERRRRRRRRRWRERSSRARARARASTHAPAGDAG